ncbi:nucleoside deaminase [Actinomyces howellii]|nr:nucleoside deaminase [Actinomyces howellii]
MRRALELAAQAGRQGEVPVGAVVLGPHGEPLAEAANARQAEHDPTAHAEIRALRAAGAAWGGSHLEGCTLVVTLEPCTMCAGAIVLARVARVVFAAWEPRTGACGSVRDVVRDPRANHVVEVVAGLRAEESRALLTEFFAPRR